MGGQIGIWLCFGRFPAEGHKMGQLGNLAVVGILTIASGLLDARGFVYAAQAWPGGQLDLKMGLASLLSFAGGVSAYIVAIKFMQNAGIHGVALQSGIWFVATAIGIAALDGSVVQWTRLQQAVALVVMLGLAWLIATAHEAH